MGSLNPENEANKELNDSGYVQDEIPKLAPEVEEYRGTAGLLDLSDDVLLIILRTCSPQDLKSLGFTCARLGALALDRSLWTAVDARAAPLGRRRVRWLLQRALGPHTRALRLRGYADQAEGCLGYMTNYNLPETTDADGSSIASLGAEERYLCGGPRIYRLTQTLPSVVRYGGSPVSAPSGCPGPQLTLTHTALRELARRCTALTALDLDYCVIDCRTTNIGMFPKTLKKLSLKGTKCFNLESRSFLFKIQDHLLELEELDVSYCDWIEPACMLPLSKVPRLRALSMRDCYKLAEFVAYASLATRYGFKELQYLDLRGSPVGDSEVSAMGWLPVLQELLLAPAPDPPRPRDHAHYSQDPLPSYNELEEWEEKEPDYFRAPTISEADWIRDEEDVRGNRSMYYSNCDDPTAESYRRFMIRPTHGHPPAGYSLFIRRPDDDAFDEPGPSKRSKPGTSEENAQAGQSKPSGSGVVCSCGPLRAAPAGSDEASGSTGPSGSGSTVPTGSSGTSDSVGPSSSAGPPDSDVPPGSVPTSAGTFNADSILTPVKIWVPGPGPSGLGGPSNSDELSIAAEASTDTGSSRPAESSGSAGPSDSAEPSGSSGPSGSAGPSGSDGIPGSPVPLSSARTSGSVPPRSSSSVRPALFAQPSGSDSPFAPLIPTEAAAPSASAKPISFAGLLKPAKVTSLGASNSAGASGSAGPKGSAKQKESGAPKGSDKVSGKATGSVQPKESRGPSGSDKHKKSDKHKGSDKQAGESKASKSSKGSDKSADDGGSGAPPRKRDAATATDGAPPAKRACAQTELPAPPGPAAPPAPAAELSDEQRFREYYESMRHPRRVFEITINEMNRRRARRAAPAGDPGDDGSSDDDDDDDEESDGEPAAGDASSDSESSDAEPAPEPEPAAAGAEAPRVYQFRQYRRPIVIEEYINVADPEAPGVLPRGVLFPGSPTRLEHAALVSDSSIRRFGRALADNINYIQIGAPAAAGDGHARPDRSSLRALSVTGFRHVTDASLAHLATAAPLLQRLDVTGTSVTPRGLRRFREARPDVLVVFSECDE